MVMSKQSEDIVRQWEEQKEMERHGDAFTKILSKLSKEIKGSKSAPRKNQRKRNER